MIIEISHRGVGTHAIEFRMRIGVDRQHLTATGPAQRMTHTEFQWFVRALQVGGGFDNVTTYPDTAPPSRWIPIGSDGQLAPRATPTDPGYEPDSEDTGPDLDALAGGGTP